METFPRMHVSLYVSDIRKSTSFYQTLFNIAPVKVRPGYAKFVLEQPSLIISFVENAAFVQPGFGHLGFQVETQEILEEMRKHFQSEGLIRLVENDTVCCYARQDKFWLDDPDGYQWEIYYFHNDTQEKSSQITEGACCIAMAEPEPANEACCAPGCC